MIIGTNTNRKIIKSPLNYIGGKSKILDQILPLLPKNISTFVDLFAGGFNVGINVNANKVILNDNLTYLVDMYKCFKEKSLDETLLFIKNRINEYGLSLTNEDAYKQLRFEYNKHKQPLDLFVLIAYSFNHQIRFNNNHEFNNPFGKERSCFNKTMELNLEQFICRLKESDVEFYNNCFTEFDFSNLNNNDFVYCDPPYLITTGTYNDGKRGFKGWSNKEEKLLLMQLDYLDRKGIKFALSNVIEHKGKSNEILKDWLKENSKYVINYVDYDYSNSNYQTIVKDKNSSVEVLITNYKPIPPIKELSLFDSLDAKYL